MIITTYSILICAVFLAIFEYSLAIKCKSGDSSIDYYTSTKFSYSQSDNLDIFQSRYLPSTGNTYHYLKVNSTSDTLLIKIDANDKITWSRTYRVKPVQHMFDVSPDYSVLYFSQLNSTDFHIFKVNTSDGSITLAAKNDPSGNGFRTSQWYSKLSVAEDSSSVHIFGYESPNSVYCILHQSQNDLRCIQNLLYQSNGYLFTDAIYAVNQDVSYVTTETYSGSFLEVRKIDFGDSTNFVAWSTRVN